MHLVVYTDAAERGGAESSMGMFIERFRPDIRVTVVGPHEQVIRWLAGRRPGSRYMVLDEIHDRSDVRAMVQHRRALRWLQPDLVHFNLSTMSSCQWALAAALTIPGLPVVVLEHSPVGTWSSLSNRLKRITSARADAHVAVGHRAARIIEELGELPEGSMRVIHSGVPIVELHPPARTSDDFTVGMLSRHDPVKGIDLAIRAVDRLGPGSRLVVVGDGSERPALEALVDELGVGDRVELRGWDDHARDVLPTFDVYLLPSRLEAFPVTVMEAMQAGVPVVATDVGSVREAVDDGETGLVVPVEDLDAIVDALALLRDDPARRTAMGERAREVGLERFDADAAVQSWEALYDEVIAARRR
ncbi:glycosyltransferase family 4 protein [Dermatobacter hominis]|uniref:glycosyltransferase family 4 protein n=1 Tax=Dermatobacter hominis TaxID=2884263 RepID=UPI001D10B09D|nr:glycosyltransferase family 4 protein [Dermatobacter hominis]UDY34047.1 glycosyltransferase family 4 protein [Dermatobacter hominis]